MQYLEQTLRRWLAKEQGARLCPAPDCPYAELLQQPRSACEMKFVCQHPDCGRMFCYKCKKQWHPGQECTPNSEVVRISWKLYMIYITYRVVIHLVKEPNLVPAVAVLY